MLKRTLLAAVAALAAITAAPAFAQNVNAEPNYGSIRLRSGFLPDPQVIDVDAGGNRPASQLDDRCRGFISRAPDVRLHYSAGTLPLIISADSRADTTLVINAPDGSWYCDDDGGVGPLNPSIRFDDPDSGRYEIWVGTYSAGPTAPAELNISEIRSE